jgi:predicted nucleic acid-binding protein
VPVSLKAYVETTIVSYLTAWPSRDLVRAAHQQVTREWWATRGSFELFISQFVLDEAAVGDATAAAQRLDALRDIALLDVTEDAILLAGDLVAGGGLPAKARVDALHVAMAAVHGMDLLLTWNCKHIANAATRGTIEDLCRTAGFEPPTICTPLELPKD